MAKTELFPNPLARKAFEDYDLALRLRNLKIGCILVAVLMPAGTALDANVYPQEVGHFLKLRFLCSVSVLLVLGLLYTGLGRRFCKALGLLVPLLPIFFISWMIYATQGSQSPYYAGITLVLVGVAVIIPWTGRESLLVMAFSILTYAGACYLNGSLRMSGILYNNFYFLILIGVNVVIGSYFNNRLRIRDFLRRLELDENRRTLEEANRKLIELDELKMSFFANINHELRTPLTLLIAPLEALQREKAHLFDEETRETLRTMQNNAMRLLKLINDLLDLVKLESSKMEVRKESVELLDFLKGLALSVQGAAKDKKVHLTCRTGEGLGTVLADRDKIEKILLNLLFNSVKFTPPGGRIELSAEAGDGALVLRVADTGMGISPEQLPHIFDRFWQADVSAQRKYQGTGIGLSLVKELTEAQGGTITAESQVGQGTTMTVRLPLERPSEAPAPAPPGQVPPQSAEWLEKLYRRAELFPAMTPVGATLHRDEFGRGRKPKVLVADDEPDMLRFLKTQLERHYEVLEAVDGNQAVEKARQYLPDAVVLDMMMPEKDGIEACRELKAQVSTQAIPVILLTARADEETKMRALESGASDFLTKPFSTAELHVRVKNLIESHQYQRDLAAQKIALESTLEQLKETEGQLVQNEKMASLGRLSAGIIHEINNPLNYATQALYLLKGKKDRMPEEERAKYVEIVSDIEEGVDRVQRIVSDLRSFSHPHAGGADLIDLKEVVSMAVRFLNHEMKDRVTVQVEVPEDQQVLADRNKLVHVFVNLLQNSLDALKGKKFEGEAPLLTIRSRLEGGRVLVTVRDNGTGIDPVDLDKVFDPFFTTKDVGQGMGLGLSICYRIMAEQGGGISVRSEKGKFTEFTLELPAREPAVGRNN
jgi:signal transduction histidine kinase